MSFLSKLSLKNSVAVIILFALILGYGAFSATQIKQQTFPDIEFPAVFIQVVDPGASTEEIETGVTKPIEDSLKAMTGYDSFTSTTSENAASISIQYPFGSDMDKLSADIEALLAKLNLPENANVTLRRLSAGASPIYQAALFSGNNDSQALSKKLVEEIVPSLQKLNGVSSVALKGISSDKLQIVVDKEKAASLGITLSTIQSALQGLNYALPLGSVSENQITIPIRLSGSVSTLQQIQDLPLSSTAAGGGMKSPAGAGTSASVPQISAAAAIKLSDLATITTVSTADEITRFNGEPSYVLEVIKNQDANTADVADAVQSQLDSYKDDNLEVHVIMNQGEEIKASVSSLIREGLYGALFCIIIIFLFLRNVRATFISILSLPISIFATMAVMNQLGYTLNIMTLGGIAVSIGRIVDDSIVVIENIYRWRQEKGNTLKGKELAYRATKEVISPVFSSTLATVVVFAPLAFVSGIIGEFFRPFSLAVVISIVTSLLVAVMLIPVLGAAFFNNVKPHKKESKLTGYYARIIYAALKRKWLVISLALVLLVGSLSTIPLIGVAFLPADSLPTASINLTLPAGSGLEQSNKVSQEVEKYISKLEGVNNYQVSIGGSADNPFRSSGGGNQAAVTVQFADGTDMDGIIDKAKATLPALVEASVSGTTVAVKEGEQQGLPSGNNIDVSLYSDNIDDLSKAAKQVEALMKQSVDLKDVTNNMNEVTPKWELTLNQKGIDEKISPFALMQAVTEQLKPVNAGTFKLDNQTRAIVLSYQQKITSLDELKGIQLPTAGGMRTLSDVADVTVEDALVTVNHSEGKTYAQVSGTVKGEDTAAVTKAVKADIGSLTLPKDVEINYGGGLAMITEGFTNLGIAMAVAVGLVFLVMSFTFGGVVTPLIILSSLVFIPVGSLGALLITGQALSMSSMIGMLMLVGIVVTNAVVLLDRVEKNRKSGQPITEAIVEASTTRLRPILMTALATMLALLPLALSGSSTSLISGGLAVTVIGGLFSSTLLTLIVVPVLYELVWKKRKVKVTENF
ncbi:efflux RND transporter permease subunit [Paenibacillus sp. 19GGS1-52]|uniref:efflux RND transporter permease subunit n=1 Tax=Paenibacillus sp. 19GGS1-52 TaxID=2758563 RepID=UPI001EFAA36B|nr:efflux RND transporter permease subunit [Paenibacillus sp. 19GGS1-52]ULO09914.1 efflux RND transporter permease subunit [Paenibacillus sp. 19GGS1-52]